MDTVRDIQEHLREEGFPAKMPNRGDGILPPGELWTVPHFVQFAAVYNWASRTYHWSFDAALQDSSLNAEVMRSDYVVKPALRSRQRPVCQLEWHLEPIDETNDQLNKDAFQLTRIIKRIPKFQQLKRVLLEALFYGKYGAQWKTRWDYSLGYKELIVDSWIPVHGDKIVIKYDGTPGILVNSTAFDGTTELTERGQAHFCNPVERQFFLVHEFEPEDADFYHAENAGVVHGLGYRGTLYWLWWLREKLTMILMDFLEKVGTGITIFYYEAGNEKSKQDVEDAARKQIGNNVFLFPRSRDGQTAYGPGIERVEVSMTGADMFYRLYNLFNTMIRQAILGEVGTTEEMSSGLGSSIGEQHGITADERTRYDAVDLEDTFQNLVNTLAFYNCPGRPAPQFKFMTESRDPSAYMQAAQFGYEAGLEIDENDMREVLGLPKPQPGSPTLSKLQGLQPAAVGSTPTGVPMAAPGGPAAQVDQSGQVDPAQPSPDQQQQEVVQGTPVQAA